MGVFNATESIRVLECYNQNVNAVPSWGVMMSADLQDPNTGILKVDQPNADNLTTVLFNDAIAIPGQSYGTGSYDFPNWAAYNAADGTPAKGDQWGVANGSWTLRKNKTGFLVLGVDTTNSRVLVIPAGGGGGLNFIWALLTGPPAAVASAVGSGGTIPAGVYYILTMWVTPETPDGHFSAGAPAAVTCVANDSITVTAPTGSHPANATGWQAYMANSSTGIFSQAGGVNALGANATLTAVGSGENLKAFGYAWKQQSITKTVVDQGPPVGTFTDTPSGKTGTTFNNPAYEIALSPWVGSNVIVQLYTGFNRGGNIGQEYLFVGGATKNLTVVSSITCQSGQPVEVTYQLNITNGTVKAVF